MFSRFAVAIMMILANVAGVIVTQAVWDVGFFAPPPCVTEDGGPVPCVWVGTTPDENGLYVKINFSREPW
jgi:hypothetical protein